MAPSMSQFLPLPELLRLARAHTTDERHRGRLRARLIFSALVEPLRWYERLRYGAQLRRTEVAAAPVFLLGFGRSGTTHLHNLFWQDGRFGLVTNYQANVQPIALCGRGWLDRYLAGKMPARRPMDNVAVALDGPQEEEIALLNSTADAPLHFMSYPRALPRIYERFYRGDIAEELVRGVREEGGLFTREDLSGWKVKIEEPTMTTYRGIEVYKLQVWHQGPALLQALNILENADVKSLGYNSTRYLHLVYQAMSLAFADRDFYYGDPAFPPDEPVRGLLSKEYAKQRYGQINWERNDSLVRPGDPYPFQGGTNPFR